jgi:hypothetical protein
MDALWRRNGQEGTLASPLPDKSGQGGSPPSGLLAVLGSYRALPGARPARLLSRAVVVILVFHVNCDAHPGMDAALKMMFPFREAINQKLAAL